MQAKPSSEEWPLPCPVWPWETRKFTNRMNRSGPWRSRRPLGSCAGLRDVNKRGVTDCSTAGPKQYRGRQSSQVKTHVSAADSVCVRPPEPNPGTAPPGIQNSERLPISAEPGVLYSDPAEMLWRHSGIPMEPYVRGCRLPQLEGGTDHCTPPLDTKDGPAFSAIAPHSLEEVSRDLLLTHMVSLLNSEESSLLCVGVASNGRVVGASASAAALARFIRGVLIINQKFILPHIARGAHNQRCRVRCVPVRGGGGTHSLGKNLWVVEILLCADKGTYYNPYSNTNYYFRAANGAASCVLFAQFCCSIVNTSVARYAASSIQVKYNEVMDLEKRLTDLQLLKQSDEVQGVSPSENSQLSDHRKTTVQNPRTEVRTYTDNEEKSASYDSNDIANQDNCHKSKPQQFREQSPEWKVEHLCELCWLRDCPLDSY